MNGNSNVMVVVDLDKDSTDVVDKAVWLSKRIDADVELLVCDPNEGIFQSGIFLSNEAKEIGEEIERAKQTIVDGLLSSVSTQGIKVSTYSVKTRPIAEEILDRAEQLEPLFVFKSTLHHTEIERSIILDTDWELIRRCRFPLWLVKSGSVRRAPTFVAAVDPVHEHDKPAELDQKIIEMAIYLADKTNGHVDLFHSYEPLAVIGAAVAKAIKPVKIRIEEITERMRIEHQKALDELASGYEFEKSSVHQLPGRAHELLPSFARGKDADVVVMGALARWGARRMIVGSTSERALDLMPCDVLLVRADEDMSCD